MHLPLLKWSGWGGGRCCQEPSHRTAPNTSGVGGVVFVPWVRKNPTPLAAEGLGLDSLMSNLAGHKLGSK